MMSMARQAGKASFGSKTDFPYQRSSAPLKKTAQRAAQREKAKTTVLAQAAQGSRPLAHWFVNSPTPTSLNTQDSDQLACPSNEAPSHVVREEKRDAARKDLELKLKSKRTRLTKQNLSRHLAVLQFMNYQKQILEAGLWEPRAVVALNVSRCFNRGKYFAEKLITWEREWIKERCIPEGKQGCFVKAGSWFNDEGVMLTAREYLSGAGESKSTLCIFRIHC
jgi:hypothetical protein